MREPQNVHVLLIKMDICPMVWKEALVLMSEQNKSLLPELFRKFAFLWPISFLPLLCVQCCSLNPIPKLYYI